MIQKEIQESKKKVIPKEIKESKKKVIQKEITELKKKGVKMVICVDTTELGAFGNLFLAVDLAARCIIGHVYRSVALDSNDVIECLTNCFNDRSFLPPIRIVHSDIGGKRGSLFKSEIFKEFLKKRDIRPSRGSSKAHENQVIERLNLTIKERIKTQLDPTWRKSGDKPETNPLQTQSMDSNEFLEVVKTVIEDYNNSGHTTLHGLTPNQVEDLLFEKWYRNGGTTEVALYETQSVEYPKFMGGVKEEVTVSIQHDFLSAVKEEYAGDWQRFFIEWRSEQTERHNAVLERQNAILAGMEKAHATLYEQYLQVQKELKVLREEADHARAERESKEARRQQKANRKCHLGSIDQKKSKMD